ncbi:UDP-N-acetylmuramoyl-tripeptide--D-alanyl-D-alanine ligase [Nocardia amikacinitolerans]|uniref:UDP-N-acetylmuramoyl-tripeptide--D-alanyl-D- alanine ligase n=1 Tax=Nocardia amikacinitolerans TaxID=756689 RepID=UPI0008315CDD|nr:UDP-N-acetylmuramoyl-tripeptide--D-alanyl-D-alanine ligase [Nocardia amikacinitolerans]MCP2320934.1 UDP-N-acetylmuramoyl-tripeptide--D-alanyl-D-alanine ligase [Nocardia amikacinitolerans]
MIPMTLAEVAHAVGGRLDTVDDAERAVTAATAFDSRQVEPGGLFAALTGKRVDGHDFATAAIGAGAVAVLASHPTGTPAIIVEDVVRAMSDLARVVATRYTGRVLAITGSAGKTSTKDLLTQILSRHGSVVATQRSFNNEIGFPHTVLRVRTDTDYLVLEMGARGRGHIAHLSAIARPQIGAVLGIGSAHLGEFGSREAIAVAKRELVEALDTSGVAVLNADDPLVAAMAEHTRAQVLRFGTGPEADVRASDITLDANARAQFTLRHGDDAAPVTLGVVGEHHLTNALAAAALALSAGVGFATVTEGLNGASLVSGSRMEVTERPDGVTVINDAFNASPESVDAALRSLATIAAATRPTVAVLGEMRELGATAPALHARIGRRVADLGIDTLIAVGGCHAELMATAARDAGSAQVTHVGTKDQVLALITEGLRGRDVVLIKGANSAALFETAAALATGH